MEAGLLTLVGVIQGKLQGLGLAVGLVVVDWRCQSAQTDEGGVNVKHRLLGDDEDEDYEIGRRCGYISARTPLTFRCAALSSCVRQKVAPGSNALKRPLLCNARNGLATSITAINPFNSGSDTARAWKLRRKLTMDGDERNNSLPARIFGVGWQRPSGLSFGVAQLRFFVEQ
jgi:hypothetical protein